MIYKKIVLFSGSIFIFSMHLSSHIPLVDSMLEKKIKKAIVDEDTSALEGIYRKKLAPTKDEITVNTHMKAKKENIFKTGPLTYITPLQFALVNKKNKSVAFLVENLKADVNEIDLSMHSPFQYHVPLDYAIVAKNFEMVPFLIAHGARLNPVIEQYPNRLYSDGASSLHSILSSAIESGHNDTIMFLINKGIAVFPEHYRELIKNQNLSVVQTLIKLKKMRVSSELLDEALEAHADTIIKYLLKNNVPITASSVITALQTNHFSYAQSFLDTLQNCNEPFQGKTIPYVAAEINNLEFLKYCLETKKADPNKISTGSIEYFSSLPYPSQSFENATPLTIAIHKGYFPMVRYLIENAKVDPQSTVILVKKDEKCNSASGICTPTITKATLSMLSLALLNKRFDIALYLLDHGAKASKRDIETAPPKTPASLINKLKLNSVSAHDNTSRIQ